MNLLVWHDMPHWKVCLFPRSKHRPSCYGTDEGALLVSPGAVDMGGLLITPLEKDFDRISGSDVRMIYQEVSMDGLQVEQVMRQLKERV